MHTKSILPSLTPSLPDYLAPELVLPCAPSHSSCFVFRFRRGPKVVLWSTSIQSLILPIRPSPDDLLTRMKAGEVVCHPGRKEMDVKHWMIPAARKSIWQTWNLLSQQRRTKHAMAATMMSSLQRTAAGLMLRMTSRRKMSPRMKPDYSDCPSQWKFHGRVLETSASHFPRRQTGRHPCSAQKNSCPHLWPIGLVPSSSQSERWCSHSLYQGRGHSQGSLGWTGQSVVWQVQKVAKVRNPLAMRMRLPKNKACSLTVWRSIWTVLRPTTICQRGKWQAVRPPPREAAISCAGMATIFTRIHKPRETSAHLQATIARHGAQQASAQIPLPTKEKIALQGTWHPDLVTGNFLSALRHGSLDWSCRRCRCRFAGRGSCSWPCWSGLQRRWRSSCIHGLLTCWIAESWIVHIAWYRCSNTFTQRYSFVCVCVTLINHGRWKRKYAHVYANCRCPRIRFLIMLLSLAMYLEPWVPASLQVRISHAFEIRCAACLAFHVALSLFYYLHCRQSSQSTSIASFTASMGLTRRINPGFVAKRGTVAKRPASKKCLEYKSVKYVRGERDLPPARVRLDRVNWKCTVPELLQATDRQIVQILQQDKMLPKWKGKVFPHCQRGHLQEEVRYGKPHYRCRAKGRQRYVSLQYLHHLAIGINHKAIEDMFSRIAAARQAYVVEKQKSIVFGHEKSWVDVEADEATFQRTNVSKDVEYKDSAQAGKAILWEQWSGIMVRFYPGPGAIRKVDWQPYRQSTSWTPTLSCTRTVRKVTRQEWRVFFMMRLSIARRRRNHHAERRPNGDLHNMSG